MLAEGGGTPFDDPAWWFEPKLDGIRALAELSTGDTTLRTRGGNDVTPKYPELHMLHELVDQVNAVVDGEIVAFDEDGRPSFERLQSRMHLTGKTAIKRRSQELPVTYVIFDLLWLAGHSTTGLAYRDRRKLLTELDLDGDCWRTPAHHEGEGAALLEATRAQGLEGIMAKRLDSTYEPGRRSSAWIKVKNVLRQEVVIGGWSPGEGNRESTLGAVCAGVHDSDGALRYVGKVGSGFTAETLDLVLGKLAPLRRDTTPFVGRQPPRNTVFVEPELVAEVELREWTRTNTMRAPVFKWLRDDVDVAGIVREA
jgi:bifunctional non-homologous end joining protein LigD